MRLPEPTDVKTLLLKKMLTQPCVTFKDFPTGFAIRSRVSDLIRKYKIDITSSPVKFKNRFGRTGNHARYSLTITSSDDRNKFVQKYLSLVKKKPDKSATT